MSSSILRHGAKRGDYTIGSGHSLNPRGKSTIFEYTPDLADSRMSGRTAGVRAPVAGPEAIGGRQRRRPSGPSGPA